uniref:glycosyltransferase family 2 protein n=1 Tax=Microbulbifer agarilyticus TaxID=260552 RepID=UPI000255B938|nr:glycosyltransferase [Microbulbifer agarilyticus]
MSKVNVSVVVTVHNSGSYLRKCLSSLADQTMSEIEVIIVNDASPDPEDSKIINDFLGDPRFKLLNNPHNLGTGISRERGVKASIGEYIGFLDSDDFVEPYAFEVLYKFAVENGCEISVCDFHTTNSNDVALNERVIPQGVPFEVVSGEDLFVSQLRRAFRPYYLRVDWWNKIYKRSIFLENDITFPKVVRNEGTMSMIMSLLAKRCAIVNLPVFYSLTRKDSVCRKFREKNIQDIIDSTLHFKSWLLRLKKYSQINQELYLNFFYFVVFNHNLQLILRSNGENQRKYLKLLLDSILNNIEVKLDFYRYLALPSKSIERRVFRQLRSGSYNDTSLKEIFSTDFFIRNQGGKRLREKRIESSAKPLVSIVTITKDLIKGQRREFFERMVSSVNSQSYGRKNIEHVIIDGRSDDGTIGYIRELDSQGLVDYWVSEADSGIYNAMNKAVLFTAGKYILFLNSDDYLAENSIELLVDAIESSASDYAFGNAYKVDESENKVGTHVGDIDKVFFGAPYCHQTLLCKKECLVDSPFDESFKITMWQFALDLVLNGYRHAYINEFLAFFRVGGISTDDRHQKAFVEEQKSIKINLAEQLNLSYSEYEYFNHVIRRWDKSSLRSVEKELLAHKLLSARSAFDGKFFEGVVRLMLKAV